MDAITWGHIVALAGLADLAGAVWFAMSAARLAGHGIGTPLYARARVSRRLSVLSAASGFLLLAIGMLTPLWRMEIV